MSLLHHKDRGPQATIILFRKPTKCLRGTAREGHQLYYLLSAFCPSVRGERQNNAILLRSYIGATRGDPGMDRRGGFGQNPC